MSLPFRKLGPALNTFFFQPTSPLPLGVLRIGLTAVLLGQAHLVQPVILDYFSSSGIVQGELARYLGVDNTPQIHWLVQRCAPLGISETSCIYAVCGAYVFSLLLMGLGLFTRPATLLAWFLHWTLLNSGSPYNYGADTFAHVFLFYLIWMPAGNALSLDVAWRRKSSAPSAAACLGLRFLQLHLCLVYLSSGLMKAMGPQWWNGELLWRALTLPVYRQFDMSWLAHWPLVSKLGGWATLMIELGYAIFIWPRSTRKLWLTATVFMHAGIAFLLGLGVFGAIMCVLNIAIFGVTDQPKEPAPAPPQRQPT